MHTTSLAADSNVSIFTAEQLDALRSAFSTIETVSPSRLASFHCLFDGCTNAGLIQLAGANIKFVSKLAVNAVTRREL